MEPREMAPMPLDTAHQLLINAKNLDDLPVISDTVLGDPQSDIGVVLQHGYSGTNLEMTYLANYLAITGIRVIIPLLPGHGSTSDDLLNVEPQDWIDKITRGYDYLREENADRLIFTAGHSLGGSLSFILATLRDVAGIISIAGPVKYPWYLRVLGKMTKGIKYKIPYEEFQFYDEEFYEHPGIQYFTQTYGKTPIKALGDVLTITRQAYAALPKLEVPTCLLYSKLDKTVPPYHAKVITEKIASRDIETHWFSQSYHILVIDEDRELLAEKMLYFIKRITSSNQKTPKPNQIELSEFSYETK